MFTLNALVMAGPDFPKPELSDSLEYSIFFCTFAGVGGWGRHHIYNCFGVHQPHFLPLSWSQYWMRVAPDVRKGKGVNLVATFPSRGFPASSGQLLVISLLF